MRHFVVTLMLLISSVAMAKRPSDRTVFPAELTAADLPPSGTAHRHTHVFDFDLRVERLAAGKLDSLQSQWSRIIRIDAPPSMH